MDNDPFDTFHSFEPLSKREREILVLLADNLSDREIAERLVVSYSTVKWYNRQIFNKLGVDSRQRAVSLAANLGLLGKRDHREIPNRSLPAQLTPFVGRVAELEDLSRLLNHPPTRLVTILAPGGMGKTRLGLATAEIAQRQFADGVCFVSLSSLISADHLIPMIAEVIGLPLIADGHAPRQQIVNFFRSKRLLLVLDNFEHALDDAALAADILAAAPQVKILTTSRERLNLEGETVYTLGGLAYPELVGTGNPPDYAAVELFVECARRAAPRLDIQDDANVVRLCQLVQGMPLAIELAAAWTGMLTPAEIAEEITRSADFLQTTMRNVPERLRSVRAVFEAAWTRLTENEREVYRRLSVFRGGCTREAAREVTGADLNMLAGLVSKALLWHRAERGRYELHELLRQYAEEQLEAAGEAEATRDAHRTYFGKVAHDLSMALRTPKQLEAIDALDADIENIRAGFARAIESSMPDVILPFTDIWHYYEIRGWYAEGEQIYRAAVEKLVGQDDLTLGKALAGQAMFLARLDRYAETIVIEEQSIEMLQCAGAVYETWHPLSMLAEAAGGLGDNERRTACYGEMFEIGRTYDDPWVSSITLYLLGGDALNSGNIEEAQKRMSEALDMNMKLGNVWGIGFVLRDLAYIAEESGDYAEARRLHELSLGNARITRHPLIMRDALTELSAFTLIQGNLPLAREYAEDVLQLERDWGQNSIGEFLPLIRLAEVEIAAGRYRDAKARLLEALRMLADIHVQLTLAFCMVTSLLLANTGAGAHAVTLISYLHQDLRYKGTFGRYDREMLSELLQRLQAELPPDVFTAAWEQGQSLSPDDMLRMVRALL